MTYRSFTTANDCFVADHYPVLSPIEDRRLLRSAMLSRNRSTTMSIATELRQCSHLESVVRQPHRSLRTHETGTPAAELLSEQPAGA